MRELIVDNFAGGGGASTGIELALGFSPDVAIDHDAEAVAMHTANHPETFHYTQKITAINPNHVMPGRAIGLAWFSPDCKHFSKAKGGAPVEKNIRDLAWTVVAWAETRRPRVIILENVEEFTTWGPLLVDENGNRYPDPARKGETFVEWIHRLRACGYEVDWRELRACDYGAPTIRKRLFLVARCDGQPIVWPKPTHGPGGLPYRTAAECIDWSIPCPSIFGRERPLAEATLRRIARGVQRFVLEAAEPFIVPVTHLGDGRVYSRARGVDQPMATLTTTTNNGCLATAFLAQHNGGMTGHDLRKPISTLTTSGSHQQLVLAFLSKYFSTAIGAAANEPMHTVTTKARFGLVTVHGQEYQIVDIGMRMLTPRELFRAQGFPESYIIDCDGPEGKPLTKTSQIRMCGNSVCPPMAAAMVRANYQPQEDTGARPLRTKRRRAPVATRQAVLDLCG